MAMKKNTAASITFCLVSATDGSAVTTGSPAAYVTIDGGTQAAATNSPVHEGNGQWSLALTAGELNGDSIGVVIALAGAVLVNIDIHTETKLVSELNDVSEAAVNAQCDAAISDVGLTSTITGRIDAAISTRATVTAIWDALTSTLTTASSIGKLIVDNLNAAITSRAATGAKMDLVDAPNATAVAAFTAGVWAALTSGMATAGSIGKKLADWVVGTIDTYTGNTKQTGDAFARLGAPAGASVSADVAAVKSDTAATLADTNELQTNQGNWLTATGFSTFNPATDTVARVTLVDTCTTNTDLGAVDAKIDIIQVAAVLLRKLRTGNVRDKSGVPGTIEILDDDGTTVIATIALSETTPYQAVTLA